MLFVMFLEAEANRQHTNEMGHCCVFPLVRGICVTSDSFYIAFVGDSSGAVRSNSIHNLPSVASSPSLTS